MTQNRAAKLLKKIHESRPLLTMLERLGKTPYEARHMLAETESSLDADLLELQYVKKSLFFLKKEVANIQCEEWAVCHGDVNHNNWLLSDQNELYLIDWDGAKIADPALDIGLLLYWYIPRKDWSTWLKRYGKELSPEFELRMQWYVNAYTLLDIQWHKNKSRHQEMNQRLDYLRTLIYE